MTDEQAGKDDPEGGFHRARRALRHLWNINRGQNEFDPNECDGCKEVYKYLTDPAYRGDTHYPAWDRLDDRDWALGPDDFENVKQQEERAKIFASP